MKKQVVRMMIITLTSEMIGVRIDKALSEALNKSREQISELIKEKFILVNDKEVKPSHKIEENDVISCLLYQMELKSAINGVFRPGIVHRIDKDTSGLLMIAKNENAMISLTDQLKEHSCNRIYVGLVYGLIGENEGKIIAPIGRNKDDRKKMAVVEDGKEAITHFKVLERYKGFTLCEFKLETGRTHQIRVHMKYIGHPLVGDPVYGPRHIIGDHGQMLHAKTIGFVHPTTNKYMEFTSELPDYFKEYLDTLEIIRK